MKSYTYLLIDLGAVIIPLIFSFHPRLNFYKKWRAIIISISIVGLVFVSWDIIFTDMGIWGFNPNYLSGLYLFNLPLEEILFFICIPFACMFTYHCFKLFSPIHTSKLSEKFSYLLVFFLLVVGFYFIDKWYPSVTFLALAILLLIIQKVFNPNWLPRLYTTLLVLIIPFLLVNGTLTGTGLEEPVVWYNENEIIGLRIFTVPIEDFFYGTLMILSNVFLLEKFDND